MSKRTFDSNSAGSVGRSAATPAGRSAEPGTVAICFVTAALESVRARNLKEDELLAGVGLSPSLLQAPQARVSAKVYGTLWRNIALVLDDEFFGQDSRRMKAGSFAMLCHLIIDCKTLGKALARSLRFYGLILDDISATLERDAKEARLILHEKTARASSQRVFAHELLLMLLYGVSCWLVGRRIPILRSEFSYAEPKHSAEYRVMYCADLYFNRPNTVIAFEASYLDLRVVQNDDSLKEFLRTAPENILLKYKNGSSLTARVRRRLRQCLPGEVLDLDELAGELSMTPAAIRHRLQKEGTSYQSIKDQLRRDLAITYLTHSSRAVLDIALELGFSERSAFHRAFRKWTGASPGEFRRGARVWDPQRG